MVRMLWSGSERPSDPVIPDLCEVWNWEGDETVLPGKWSAIIAEAFAGGA